MNAKYISSALLLALLFLTRPTYGQSLLNDLPIITYQGQLAQGAPVDGTHHFEVTFYSDVQGRSVLWRGEYQTLVKDGNFSLELGSGDFPLPASLGDKPLWLGLRIDDAPELRPLTRIGASALALSVPDNSITSAKLGDGAVTSNKLAADYVSGVTVNGKRIAAPGKVLNLISGEGIELRYDQASESIVLGNSGEREATRGKGAEAQAIDWNLAGNTPSSTEFLGTTDGSSLVIKVQDNRAMIYEPATTPRLIGGYSGNGARGVGTTIAGGGAENEINEIALTGGANQFSNFSFIGGGKDNNIEFNTTTASPVKLGFSVIAGGKSNEIKQDNEGGVIGGGASNFLQQGAVYSVISGGNGQWVSGTYVTMGGGLQNRDSSSYGFVGGGQHNAIGVNSDHSFLGGGKDNRAQSPLSALGGGEANMVTPGGIYNGIFAGVGNIIRGCSTAFIGGGEGNEINNNSPHSVIGGGLVHYVDGAKSVIGGGEGNYIGASIFTPSSPPYASILGGQSNTLSSDYSVIVGGQGNNVGALGGHNFIGGGWSNSVGWYNGPNFQMEADVSYATVSGGRGHLLSADYTAVPGGYSLQAAAYGQLVGGVFNRPKGTTNATWDNVRPDDSIPLFILGNGTSGATRSNAFEVSFDGHSTVYDVNGVGATNPVFKGSTYSDNIVYAWGYVTGPGNPVADFGVLTVLPGAPPNEFIVLLNIIDPQTNNQVLLSDASITATLVYTDEPPCGVSIWVSPISSTPHNGVTYSSFRVYTNRLDPSATSGETCKKEPYPFMFKVTGRGPAQ